MSGRRIRRAAGWRALPHRPLPPLLSLLLALLLAAAALAARPGAALALPPSADPGGPYQVNQGSLMQFDGTASSDPEGGTLVYAWEFGDGATGSGAQPFHVYLGNDPLYTVTLTVTDPELLSDSATTTVTVNRPPVADPGGPYSGVATQTVVFNGTGSSDPDGDPLTYLWEFGDGATGSGATPAHVYATGGPYTVTLTVEDPGGRSDTAATSIDVNRRPLADPGGPYSANRGASIGFDGSGSFDPEGSTLAYFWEFGDGATSTGATPAHVYAAAGTYTVTLTVTDDVGLDGTLATQAFINGPPVADPGGPYSGNLGQPIAFDGSASSDPDGDPLAYLWQFGDGATAAGATPSHTYASGGTFVVTLTVTDPGGLDDGAATMATINRPPQAAPGGPYAANPHEPIAFDGTGSSDPDGDALAYFWQLGDGATAAGATPSHSYATGGTYTVTLTVTDPGGLDDSAATTAAINRPPVADADGPYAANPGASILFDGTGSSDPDGDPLTYTWQFGDGATAAGATPSHSYAAGGLYTVTLTVRDPDQLTDSDISKANINRAPSADAGGPYAMNQGQPVTFDGTGSSDPDGDPLTYAWQFGDGATAAGATPSHTYATGGTFIVTLTVRDPGNLSGADVTSAGVNRPPVADAGGPYAANPHEPILFDGTGSSDPDGDPLFYLWEYGDGSTGSGVTAIHNYATGGVYTVTLTVRDPGLLTDTDATQAVIDRPPVADAGGPYSANPAQPFQFDGTGSSDPDGDPLTYHWQFGDGTSANGVTPVHVYAVGGTYTVTLTVTDPGGLADDDQTVAQINRPPTADANGPYSANLNVPIPFDGTGSSDPDGDPLTYLWQFGDGTTAGGATPIKAYASGGLFTVTLTVTDPGGLVGVDVTTADINRPPVADAGGPYGGNALAAISFDGTGSFDPDGDPLTYLWTFGDGATGSGPAPTHIYAAGGTYTAALVVRDSGGLTGTDLAAVTVNGPPSADPGGPYAGNAGELLLFDGTSSSDPEGDALTYLWEFGDGATAAGVAPAHQYAASGLYTVTLTVADPGGLSDAAATTADINGPPVADAGGTYSGNMGQPIAFDGTGSSDPDGDPLTYLWEFGDGATAAGATPSHTYVLGGLYTVTLTVTDPDQLSDDNVTSASINGAPVADPGGPYAANEGEVLQFDGTGSSDPDADPLNYFWQFGDGAQGNGAAPTHTYLIGGVTYTVTLLVVDPGGLFDTAETTVAVNGAPVVGTGGPYAGNEGESIQFDGSASSDPEGEVLTYGWEFGDGTTADSAKPAHVYAAPAAQSLYTVTLTVTDPGGLAGSAATTADINRAPLAAAGGPYAGNEGEPLAFDASASVDPDGDALTYLWEFGDGATAAGAEAAHVYAAGAALPFTVTLTVTDPGGLAGAALTTADINRAPQADAGGPYTADRGETLTLDGTASGDPDGDALTYSWQFGDGGTASGAGLAQPAHVYATGGAYTVVLAVEDALGAPGSGGLADRDSTVVEVSDLVVTSPAAGAVWSEGSAQTILWQATGDLADVRVEFRRGSDSDWELIGIVPGGDEQLVWSPVATVLADEPDSRVRIVRPAGPQHAGDLIGESEPFTIQNRVLAITTPVGGSSFFETETIVVRWETTGFVPLVDLEYRLGGSGSWVPVADGQGIVNAGEFSWTLPEVIVDRDGTLVRVRDSADPDDTSGVSAPFDLLDRNLEVTSPEPGDVWSEASPQEIHWTATGPLGEIVVEYQIGGFGGGSWIEAALVPADDEVYVWTLPPVAQDEPGSRVRVREAEPGIDEESDQSADFTIENRVLAITAPAGGAAISERTPADITWSSAGYVLAVSLEYRLRPGDADWVVIDAAVPNQPGQNTFVWSTPEIDQDEPGVQVRVTGTNPDADLARGESAPFTLIDRVINVIEPNVFTAWCEVDTVSITWEAFGRIPAVDIDWWSPFQQAWRTVVAGRANDGSYAWQLPDLPATTTELRIRITDQEDAAVIGFTDFFLGTNRELELLAPQVGDVVSEGDGVLLRWDEVCLDSVGVWIKLRATDPDWSAQGTWSAELGQIIWPVPPVDSTETDVRLRVTDPRDPDQVFSVGGPFTILNKTLVVHRPTVTDSLSEAQRFTIEWDSEGSLTRVDLALRLDPDGAWQPIATGLTNEGHYDWLVPLVDADHLAAAVKVQDAFSALADESQPFAILNRALALTAPVAGDSLSEAAPVTITWTTRGLVPVVRIDFRESSGLPWQTIAGAVQNAGSFDWLVPEVAADAPAAQLRIVDVAAADVGAVSDAFTIVDRTLVVTAPAAGAVWSEATTQTIRWRAAGAIDSVAIDYRTAPGAEWLPVVASTANDGEYAWQVPEVEERYAAAVVRIADAAAPAVDTLSAAFTLENRTIRIVAPAPAPRTEWRLGSARVVRWETTGFIEQVDVELSRNGPEGDYIALAVATDADSLAWEVLGPETYDAYVRVRDVAADHVVGVSPYPVALYDLAPPAVCGDYDHDGTVDLDDVLRVEAIIVGAVAASEADSVNFDCFADRTVDLNDLLGAVDSMLEGAAAGRGRTASGRFEDAGSAAPVVVRIGRVAEEVAGGGGGNGSSRGRGGGGGGRGELRVPVQVEAAGTVTGFLVEIEVRGTAARPVLDAALTDARLAWTPVGGDPGRFVATLRCPGNLDEGLGAAGMEALSIALAPPAAASGAGGASGGGAADLRVRLVRAEAYDAQLLALPVHVDGEAAPVVPARVTLAQNVPNPFNPATTIGFGLPAAARVRLDIYDVSGRLVRRLADGPRAAGYHHLQWDARDLRGAPVASGVYIYMLQAGPVRETRKMTVLR